MSVAKEAEVCSHRLVPRLAEPTVGVPIKKRPVSLSDRSAASSTPLSMKSSSASPGMSISAAGAGCGKESFFNIAKSDTNLITKGKGITNSQVQDHANRSLTRSMANSKGVLFNGSSEIPSYAESDRNDALVDESHGQKFLVLDLQLASRRNVKKNYGSVVKEEIVDQSFSGFPSAQPHKNVQIASGINSSNSSFWERPNLDLNVPLDPADSPEDLPTMHESADGLYHITRQHQKAQVAPAAPVSAISNQLRRNIDSTLNLSNSYELSHKCGPADVTLDLQLKPPARPELGINWKGFAPAPELSLSLFGKSMDVPGAQFYSEPAGSSKKVSEEDTTLGLDKSPVEKTVTLVPCNANSHNTTSSTVSEIEKAESNNLVKKEPEEPSQQHDDAEKAHLLEQQSVALVNNCAESEKTGTAPEVPSKTGFDLNSDSFPSNIIHNGLGVVTDNVPITAESLSDTVRTETMPVVLEVEKFMKREESANVTPSLPAIATLTDHSAPLVVAKSSPLESNGALPVVGLCESSSQPSISTFEASCSNTVCKPPANHIHAHEDMSGRPCDANEACDALRSASSPIAEPVIHSPDHAANDGMSQGSAEMDCSDDDDNTLSRLPSTDRPHVEPSGNNPTTKDGLNAHDLLKELNQEHANDMMHQGCSSLTNKASIEGVKIRDGIVSHSSGEGHQREVFINKESKDNQLFKPGKTASNTDNNMHDVKTTTGSYSTNLQMLSALQAPASPKIGSTRQSPKTLDNCTEKNRNRDIKSERSLSPCVKLAASCSEDHSKITAVKMEHGIESEEVARQFDLRPRDSVIGEDSCGASSSQPHSDCGKVQSVSEKSEYDKSGPESCKTSSAQNERDGQLVGSHWRDLGYAYVNRNERWERFIKSEREKNKGKYQSGKHTSDVINQQRTYHRRGAGSRCHPRNFRGPRNESEIDFPNEPISGRRHPFEDDLEHLHRIPHRRWRSPPAGSLMREMDVDGFPGRETGDLPDDMIQERFFMPHCHRHHARGDHGFIHRERSHSPAPRRGVPVHFHRRQSPEAMHRSPPLMRIERTYMPHCHHSRRHGSPLDRVGHDERGMQRNVRCDQALEGDAFETPLHPAHLAELHAEGGLADRRKYRDRRAYRRSLEGLPVEEDEMLSYHAEDMEFAEGGSGPREYDGRFRNRMGHRARGEQEDGYRHRGHQGWRDGDSNDSRPKRRRH